MRPYLLLFLVTFTTLTFCQTDMDSLEREHRKIISTEFRTPEGKKIEPPGDIIYKHVYDDTWLFIVNEKIVSKDNFEKIVKEKDPKNYDKFEVIRKEERIKKYTSDEKIKTVVILDY